MPSASQGVTVEPNAQTVVVTIAESGGGTPVVYADRHAQSTISMPATISTRTTFFLADPATFTVSAKVGGLENANGAGGTQTVDLTGGGIASVGVGVPTETPTLAGGTYQSLTKQFRPGTPVYAYGSSYAMDPGARCTQGQEFYRQVAKRLGSSVALSLGKSGMRTHEAAQAVIANGSAASFSTFAPGSKWVPGTPGVVLLDSETNDMFNPNAAAGTTVTALGANGADRTYQAYRAFVAVVSASARYEPPASATGWTAQTTATWSNGNHLFTSTLNAFVDVSVTVPASGVLYALNYIWTDGMGDVSYSIAGTTYGTFLGTTKTYPVFFSGAVGASGTGYKASALVTKITGLPTGAQTIRVTKTDASSGLVFCSCFLAPDPQAVPIVVVRDPLWDTSKAGVNPANTVANAPLLAANKALLDPLIATLPAEFSNVTVVDSGINNAGLGIDGLHQNDRGMRQEADAIWTGLTGWLANNDPDLLYRTTTGPTAAVPAAQTTLTSGSATITTTTYVDVAGTDVTVTALPGQFVEVGLNVLGDGSTTPPVDLDVATIVSGAAVNYVSGGATNGVPGWTIQNVAYTPATGSLLYKVTAADVVNGQVTFRLRSKLESAGSRVLFATAAVPMYLWARVLT